jgi:hypothetical protein
MSGELMGVHLEQAVLELPDWSEGWIGMEEEEACRAENF